MYILFGQRGDQYSNPERFNRWDILGCYMTMSEVEEDIHLIKDQNLEMIEGIDWCTYSHHYEPWEKRIVRVKVAECKDIFETVETCEEV